MKHLSLSLLALALPIIISCNGKADNQATKSTSPDTSKVTTDSIAAQATKPACEEQNLAWPYESDEEARFWAKMADDSNLEEADKAANFTEKDLAFWGLHGHVRRMKEESSMFPSSCGFSPSGRVKIVDRFILDNSLESGGDMYQYIEHNRQGYISEYGSIGGTTHYKWANGRITREETMYEEGQTGAYDYHYDGKGRLLNKTCDKNVEDVNVYYYEKETYTYLEFDEQGNWTKCIVRRTGCSDDMKCDTLTRTIEYYN